MLSLKDERFRKGCIPLEKIHHFQNQDQSTLIALKGVVPYLDQIGIKLAQSSLRIRDSHVLSAAELIDSNGQYRNRFIYGANWRAEIITAMQRGLDSPMKISRELGIARSRVGVVFKEFSLVKAYLSIK